MAWNRPFRACRADKHIELWEVAKVSTVSILLGVIFAGPVLKRILSLVVHCGTRKENYQIPVRHATFSFIILPFVLIGVNGMTEEPPRKKRRVACVECRQSKVRRQLHSPLPRPVRPNI